MSNAYQRAPLDMGSCTQCNEKVIYGVWKFVDRTERFCSWACSEGFITGDGSKLERLAPREPAPVVEEEEEE